MLSRNENKLKGICKNIQKGAKYFKIDLNETSTIENIILEIVEKHGPFDGFVHCAGNGEIRPLKLSKYDFILKVMNVNFFSFVEICRCLTKKGAYNPGFSIVGVSAIGAFIGNSSKTAYCSSKAAMNSAVRCIAKELAPKDIRVNTVAPGATETPMAEAFDTMKLDKKSAITERQYLGICKPINIAHTIAFLLSDFSNMITGSCIPVDGGKLTN